MAMYVRCLAQEMNRDFVTSYMLFQYKILRPFGAAQHASFAGALVFRGVQPNHGWSPGSSCWGQLLHDVKIYYKSMSPPSTEAGPPIISQETDESFPHHSKGVQNAAFLQDLNFEDASAYGGVAGRFSN
eukprot:6472333-Amphidinium_carterae.1